MNGPLLDMTGRYEAGGQVLIMVEVPKKTLIALQLLEGVILTEGSLSRNGWSLGDYLQHLTTQ